MDLKFFSEPHLCEKGRVHIILNHDDDDVETFLCQVFYILKHR